jgi:hypothetical protein
VTKTDETWVLHASASSIAVPTIRARVVSGPDARAAAEGRDGRLLIGSAETAGLRLSDPTVSRFHVELEATARGVRARDLGSTNGTWIGDTRVVEVILSRSTELGLGRMRVRVEVGADVHELPMFASSQLEGLVGGSSVMRAFFDRLARAAATHSTVLLLGESGTGKELAARAVHAASPRRRTVSRPPSAKRALSGLSVPTCPSRSRPSSRAPSRPQPRRASPTRARWSAR